MTNTTIRNEVLYHQALAHFNEPVLIIFGVGRLIGYQETREDCYWIIMMPWEKVEYHSCVGGFTALTTLKTQNIVVPSSPSFPGEIWTDYTRIDSLLQLNGAPRQEKFRLELDHNLNPFDGIMKPIR